jgi:hypothetical protein
MSAQGDVPDATGDEGVRVGVPGAEVEQRREQ